MPISAPPAPPPGPPTGPSGRSGRAAVWSRRLALFLRFQAAIICLAIFAVFLPTDWMAAINDLSGLAPLPRTPLVDYLARALSGLYTIWGALIAFTASDVDRFRPVIRFMAIGSILLGFTMAGIDFVAGMPTYWMAADGLMPTAGGAVTLVLLRLASGGRSADAVEIA